MDLGTDFGTDFLSPIFGVTRGRLFPLKSLLFLRDVPEPCSSDSLQKNGETLAVLHCHL